MNTTDTATDALGYPSSPMPPSPHERMACTCEHSRRSHRAFGIGPLVCSVYGCNCRDFKATGALVDQVLSRSDADLPKWVLAGVVVKVKSTEHTRRYGMRAGDGPDGFVWPGDLGTVERVDGEGWWSWRVRFSRGRVMGLNLRVLEDLMRVSKIVR